MIQKYLHLNKLLKDKDKLNELSQESIKRAKDFSIEIISREWVELLNQIIYLYL